MQLLFVIWIVFLLGSAVLISAFVSIYVSVLFQQRPARTAVRAFVGMTLVGGFMAAAAYIIAKGSGVPEILGDVQWTLFVCDAFAVGGFAFRAYSVGVCN